MATNPAGGSAYGNFTNTPSAVESYTHRSDTTVNTPDASYTVAELIALINTAVYTAGAVDSTGFGKASR